MGIKSPAIQGGGLLTVICIVTGIWIGIAAGPKWYWIALIAAIVLAFVAMFLPLKMYQTYKLERAKVNKHSSIIRWLISSCLYNSAWIYPFGLIGRLMKFVFAGPTN